MRKLQRFLPVLGLLIFLLVGSVFAASSFDDAKTAFEDADGPMDYLGATWDLAMGVAELEFVFGAADEGKLVGFLRLLVFITAGMLFYSLSSLVEGSLRKNIRVFLSIVLGILSTILIPPSVLLIAVGTSSLLFAVVLLIVVNLPFVAAFYFLPNDERGYLYMKSGIALVAWWISGMVSNLTEALATGAGAAIKGAAGVAVGAMDTQVATFFGFVTFAYAALCLIYLVLALFHVGTEAGSKAASWAGSGAKNKWTGFQKWRTSGKGIGNVWNSAKRAAQHEKTTLLSEYLEDQKELRLIRDAERGADAFIGYLARAKSQREVRVKEFRTNWDKFHKPFSEAHKEIARLKRDTFREERNSKALVGELRKLGVKPEKLKQVTTKERILLGENAKIVKTIKEIERSVSKAGEIGEYVHDINSLKKSVLGLDKTLPMGGSVLSALDNLTKNMEKLKTNIRQAVIDLTLSYKTAENLITAFHKVWVWKQPKLDDEGHIDF